MPARSWFAVADFSQRLKSRKPMRWDRRNRARFSILIQATLIAALFGRMRDHSERYPVDPHQKQPLDSRPGSGLFSNQNPAVTVFFEALTSGLRLKV